MMRVAGSKFAWLLGCGVLLGVPGASAWEWLPEYQSLTETEQAAFEGPHRFGSEYAADIVSYLKPAEWEYDWLTHPQMMDVSIGSVSASHFLIDNRLKVGGQLSEHFEVRFFYTNEQSRERDSVHHIFEMIWWPTQKLGLSFYGEPALYKRNNDTGLAATWKFNPRHELRVFQTFVDVTRLKRNDRNDNFIEPHLPYSRGFVGRWWGEPAKGGKEFLEYAFRQETPTRWRFPDPGYRYEYWKLFGAVFGAKHVTERVDFNFRLQVDRKVEARTRIEESSTEREQAWRTDRLLALFRGVFKELGPTQDWEVTGGVGYSDRWWRTTRGDVEYRDLLPHVLLKVPGFGAGERQDHWTAGYLTTWHRDWGPRNLREVTDVDGAWEHRLNLSYEFNFGARAKLSLMVTGDLDQAFTRRSWDGGGGTFQMVF